MQRKFLYFALLTITVLLGAPFGLFVKDNPTTVVTPSAYFFSATNDIGLMMFLGFAALYSYMKFNQLSAAGFCMVLTPLAMLLYVLWNQFWLRLFELGFQTLYVQNGAAQTYLSYYCAFAVLISLGGVYGKIGFFQAVFFLVFEVVCYSLNQIVCLRMLDCTDVGGSMLIHAFGASFGLAMCTIYKPATNSHPSYTGSRDSNYISILGSFFLMVFWPSFNSTLVTEVRKELAILNTILSLSGSVAGAFAMSALIQKKVNSLDVINSTLAGGIIIGSSCDYILNPAAAIVAGLFGGFVSTIGVNFIVKGLRAIGVQDTMGIFNLHFLPGVMGGFLSSIIILFYEYMDKDSYYVSKAKFDRGFLKQAQYQAICTGASVGAGLGSGIVLGLFLRLVFQHNYEQYMMVLKYDSKLDEVKNDAFYFNDYNEWNINLSN